MRMRWSRPAGVATPNGSMSWLTLRRVSRLLAACTSRHRPRHFRCHARHPRCLSAGLFQTKMLGLRVDDNRILCHALQFLMPGFKAKRCGCFAGPARASGDGRPMASYGHRAFRRPRNLRKVPRLPGGSVVLETVARPEAIISIVEYPPPMTEAEKAELPPGVTVVEYHEEREYLVERRLLGPVEVLRRYSPKT